MNIDFIFVIKREALNAVIYREKQYYMSITCLIRFLIYLKNIYIWISSTLHFYFLMTLFDQICLRWANYNNTVSYIFCVSLYIKDISTKNDIHFLQHLENKIYIFYLHEVYYYSVLSRFPSHVMTSENPKRLNAIL